MVNEEDIVTIREEIPNPLYHSIKQQVPASKYDKKEFDAENHHDQDKMNIFHEGEEPEGHE